MNAMQTRELMRVSRRALALIDPSWSIHRELSNALGAAVLGAEDAAPMVRKTVRRKGSKIPFACNAGAIPWSATEWPCLEPMRHMVNGSMAKFNIAVVAAGMKDKLETAEEAIARLSRCACGHTSEAHKKDALENLLECSGTNVVKGTSKPCDCDHFHYAHSAEDAAAKEAALEAA